MNSEQKKKIRGLVREFSGSGTESFLAFVAGTDGLLSACQALLHSLDSSESADSEWLRQECAQENVLLQPFVLEVRKIVALFKPEQDAEAPHAILGVPADAGIDEIKHAYRTLSRRYHPDTAVPPYRDNPEKFIAINRAYNALMNVTIAQKDKDFPQEERWRISNKRRVSPEQRRKVFTWTSVLLTVLVLISVVASMNYQKRAMLAGLQESRGAFIPPAGKASVGTGEKEVVEDPPAKEIAGAETGNSSQGSEVKAPSKAETETSSNQLQETPEKEEVITDAAPASLVMPVQQNPAVTRGDAVGQDPAGFSPAEEKSDIKPVADVKPQILTSRLETKGNEAAPPAPVSLAKGSREEAPKQVPKTRQEIAARADQKTGKPGLSGAVKKQEGGRDIAATVDEKKMDGRPVAVPASIAPVREDRADALEHDAEIVHAKTHGVTQKIGVPPLDASRLAVATVEKAVQPPAEAVEVAQITASTEESVQVAAPSAEKEQSREKDHLQARLDSFFDRYIDAYEQRDLLLFARFFEGKAEENGKHFSSIMPTYLDLFTTTKHISLQIEERSYRRVDGMVKVDGKFKVLLEYADNRKLTGFGPIHFLLAENGSEMRIRKMDYIFHSE